MTPDERLKVAAGISAIHKQCANNPRERDETVAFLLSRVEREAKIGAYRDAKEIVRDEAYGHDPAAVETRTLASIESRIADLEAGK